MGQARWRAADTIIDLAKKYIGDILVDYENYREEMNATKETKPENTVAKNIFLYGYILDTPQIVYNDVQQNGLLIHEYMV